MTSRTFAEKISSRIRRSAVRGLLVVLAILASALATGWFALPAASLQRSAHVMATVRRGLFAQDITERGTIESAKNVAIKCQVRTRSGVAILDVVPEGTIIRPEDCIPENAVVSIDALLRLDRWLNEQEPPATGVSSTEGDVATQERESPKRRPGGDSLLASTRECSGSENTPTHTTEADHRVTIATSTESAGESPCKLVSDLLPQSGDEPDRQLEGDQSATPELTFEDILDKKILVRFNSKEYEEELLRQQIACANSLAVVRTAEAAYNTALIAKQESLDGTLKQLEKTREAKIVRAKEALARSKEYFLYSEGLYKKGFIPKNELEKNRFAITDRQLATDIAELELDVLREYTYPKELQRLDAAIGSAKSRLAAVQRSYQYQLDREARIKQQIVNCTVFATHPGQVVYANERDRRGNEVMIEPGMRMWERQTILRLPDPSHMHVKAKVNESKIALVQTGMQATIHLEAVPHKQLAGEVSDVGEYPARTSWYGGQAKEYEVIIGIDGPDRSIVASTASDRGRPTGPPGHEAEGSAPTIIDNARSNQRDLRVGFTAEVAIRVAEQPDALQLPIQSIFAHGGKNYVVVPAGNGQWQPKEVQTGLSNDRCVVIEEGLEEGDQVVHNAEEYRGELTFPQIY